MAQSVAERMRNYRARRAAQIAAMADRLDEIERSVTAWNREIEVAREERRQGNAYLEQALPRLRAIEQLLAPAGDRVMPKFARNGLPKERFRDP
jgi:hypothetical protein